MLRATKHFEGEMSMAAERLSFNDVLDELQRLREAAQNYCENYLRDELDEPELCYDDKHRAAVVALWNALQTTNNVEVSRPR